MNDLEHLIQKLHTRHHLEKDEWIALIQGRTDALAAFVFSKARKVRHHYYGHDVYIRGLIEFTNYCKNDCYYCGIRKSNTNAAALPAHPRRISSPAVRRAMAWDFGLSSCKAERTAGLRMSG